MAFPSFSSFLESLNPSILQVVPTSLGWGKERNIPKLTQFTQPHLSKLHLTFINIFFLSNPLSTNLLRHPVEFILTWKNFFVEARVSMKCFLSPHFRFACFATLLLWYFNGWQIEVALMCQAALKRDEWRNLALILFLSDCKKEFSR